jgi:hypothetical protein
MIMVPAQEMSRLPDGAPAIGVGWNGFVDVNFLGRASLAMMLAAALGALLAYHPRRALTVGSLQDAVMPKVFILYAVIGAVIGMMVLKYGLVVGFVVFGIGGLTRFRTDLPSATDTGRLIFITLVGLSCGLDLPHLAALASLFGAGLLAALDARPTYHIAVKGLQRDSVGAAADAYRGALAHEGCRVLNEKKDFSKEQVSFLFRSGRAFRHDGLVQRVEARVPEALRGVIDWSVN